MEMPPPGRAQAKPETSLSIDSFAPLTLAQALAELPELAGHVFDAPDEHDVRVYRGDIVVESWKIEPDGERNTLLVVIGNVWIDRDLELSSSEGDDQALSVYVTGNVSARDVVVAGDPALVVCGELEVEDLVVVGGGNLGHVRVVQDLRCRALLQFTDGQAKVGGTCSGVVLAATAVNVSMASLPLGAPPADLLEPKFLEDGIPDRARICKAIAKGHPVLQARAGEP